MGAVAEAPPHERAVALRELEAVAVLALMDRAAQPPGAVRSAASGGWVDCPGDLLGRHELPRQDGLRAAWMAPPWWRWRRCGFGEVEAVPLTRKPERDHAGAEEDGFGSVDERLCLHVIERGEVDSVIGESSDPRAQRYQVPQGWRPKATNCSPSASTSTRWPRNPSTVQSSSGRANQREVSFLKGSSVLKGRSAFGKLPDPDRRGPVQHVFGEPEQDAHETFVAGVEIDRRCARGEDADTPVAAARQILLGRARLLPAGDPLGAFVAGLIGTAGVAEAGEDRGEVAEREARQIDLMAGR